MDKYFNFSIFSIVLTVGLVALIVSLNTSNIATTGSAAQMPCDCFVPEGTQCVDQQYIVETQATCIPETGKCLYEQVIIEDCLERDPWCEGGESNGLLITPLGCMDGVGGNAFCRYRRTTCDEIWCVVDPDGPDYCAEDGQPPRYGEGRTVADDFIN